MTEIHTHAQVLYMYIWRDVRVRGATTAGQAARVVGGVWCLAQEHLGSAQELNWHLSSYRSTLRTLVPMGT